MGQNGVVTIPVSIGELADKITILEIKSERISEPTKLISIRLELELLRQAWSESGLTSINLDETLHSLKEMNETLWTAEDEIRECERQKDFGRRFIELARSIYRSNDRRFALKHEINELTGSSILEVKSYNSY